MGRTKQSHTDDRTIGANVRRLRMLRGMSQEMLGHKLGLTFQQVQKYEKGTNRISGSRLIQIAAALQCPTEALFDGTTVNGNVAIVDDPIRLLTGTSLGIRLAIAFPKLKRELQTTIVDLCELQAS